jgi:death-on-curing protein
MRYLTLGEVVDLHRAVIEATGGAAGIRDLGALESALAQPRASFGGVDLHASLTDKAAALCFSLVNNHAFIDGNKRIGHAATETFLILNGSEIDAPVDEQERLMLDLASGRLTREQLAAWLLAHLRQPG